VIDDVLVDSERIDILYTQGTQTPPKVSLRPNDRPTRTSLMPPETTHGPNLRRGAALWSHPTDPTSGTPICDLPDQGMPGQIQGVAD
jgi:hypothetical protein